MTKSIYVLGISGWSHDAAACLLKNGVPVATAQEERFTRKKHEGRIPKKAIEYCLKHESISIDEVDKIGFYFKPLKSFRYGIYLALKRLLTDPMRTVYGFHKEISDKGNMYIDFYKNNLWGKLTYIDHHRCHAASSFYPSPFEKSAIMVLDAKGEYACTSFYEGDGLKIKHLKSVNYPHSLGWLYAKFTDHLGFEGGEDEYKVMGLASYGEPVYYEQLKDIISFIGPLEYRINLSYFEKGTIRRPFSKKIQEVIGKKRKKGEALGQNHMNIASTLQKILSETVIKLAGQLYTATHSANLCISGGIALNGVMNGELMYKSPFEKIHVAPSAGDVGTCYGAAFEIYNGLMKKKRVFVEEHDYFGPEFSDEEIEGCLKLTKLKYEKYSTENLIEKCAQYIKEGNILGWFQGRMEFGPRALGSRSILADPTRNDMKDIINKYVKHREEFRPFAPVILEEEYQKFFDIKQESPFMTIVCRVKEGVKEKLPATTHFDGTSRVQTIAKSNNEKYWRLIKRFGELSGTPVLLNTSFNIKGEPIVCTPLEAIRCFYGSGMDYLALGNFIVSK